MAVSGLIYGLMWTQLFNGEIDWDTHAIHCTLHTVTYVPNQDTHNFFDDATNELSTAGGYTAGGQALTGKTLTYTAGTNVTMLDCDDPLWTSSTLTARVAVFHDRNAGTNATRPLLCYQLSDADIVSTGGDFRVQINASGLIAITTA